MFSLNVDDCSKTKESPFDHIYHEPSSQVESVVLYADIQTETFGIFHRELKKLADSGKVRYILRYRPPISSYPSNQNKPLFVSGYGVELMLKRTDYIVIDDRDVEAGIPFALSQRSPQNTPKVKTNQNQPNQIPRPRHLTTTKKFP
jgi:hypothetical protein